MIETRLSLQWALLEGMTIEHFTRALNQATNAVPRSVPGTIFAPTLISFSPKSISAKLAYPVAAPRLTVALNVARRP
jgi:uncharacterized membrane protein